MLKLQVPQGLKRSCLCHTLELEEAIALKQGACEAQWFKCLNSGILKLAVSLWIGPTFHLPSCVEIYLPSLSMSSIAGHTEKTQNR